MATLSFLRDAQQLDHAVSKVKSGSDPSVTWVLTEVIADGDVKLVETGTDLADLCDEFADSKEMFALARLTDPNSHLAKLVLFCWCGEGVPGLRKSRFLQHLDAASAYFSGYHLRIIARDEADVDPVQIMKKVADSLGAKYSVHDQQKAAAQPPKAPASRPAATAAVAPRAITTHAVTKTAVVSPVAAAPKPVIAPKPASNMFAKPAPPAASTFKPASVAATPRPAVASTTATTTYKPVFTPSAAAFQSSTSTTTVPPANATPDASSSSGEKSARQLELEAMIKARQEREEQEYKEEMAMRSARRSRENMTVEDATSVTPTVPIPVIPAGMTKSINLSGILSAPATTIATYSPPAPAPVVAARPVVAQVQPPTPIAAPIASANEPSTTGGAAGVAAMSAMFSSLAVGSGSKSGSPTTSPRTARKWPTVGSSPSNAPIVHASAAAFEEPAAAPAPAPTPAPWPAYVAGSTVAASVAAPVVAHQPAPEPEHVVVAAASAPVLPPRGNPVYDIEPAAAPEPVVEPTPVPEPAGPMPVDTSLPNLYVAAHPFTASDATELPLQPGDLVAIVESVDGWAVVEHLGTHARGMCPTTYLDRVLDIVMALDRPDAACVAEFEFAGNAAEGELGLRAGMLVVDVVRVDDEWLDGRGYGGEVSGYFPASYVRSVAEV